MGYKHNYKSHMFVLDKEMIDTDVMEPVDGKVVAMIDPVVFDPEVMGVVGSLKPGKPLMKVVLPADLVDEESVEVVESLQSVWCDPQVDFNPATMDFVTWEKKESRRFSQEVNIQIPDVSRIFENSFTTKHHREDNAQHHRITKNRIINDLYISCIVEEGVELTIKGDNYAPLKMLKDSKVRIDGDNYGPIENDGGTLDITGDVYGPIKTENNGITNIGEDSDIYAPVN